MAPFSPGASRLLSVSTRVPGSLPWASGEKVTGSVQEAAGISFPTWEAVDGTDGQVPGLVLSSVKPVEMLGFTPEAGIANCSVPLPMLVMVTVCGRSGDPGAAVGNVRVGASAYSTKFREVVMSPNPSYAN